MGRFVVVSDVHGLSSHSFRSVSTVLSEIVAAEPPTLRSEVQRANHYTWGGGGTTLILLCFVLHSFCLIFLFLFFFTLRALLKFIIDECD